MLDCLLRFVGRDPEPDDEEIQISEAISHPPVVNITVKALRCQGSVERFAKKKDKRPRRETPEENCEDEKNCTTWLERLQMNLLDDAISCASGSSSTSCNSFENTLREDVIKRLRTNTPPGTLLRELQTVLNVE